MTPATARKMDLPYASGHAQRPRIVARDLCREDVLAAAVATAWDLATSQLKHLAKAGGISISRASRWSRDGRGNPLWDVTTAIYRLVEAGQHPGMIVAHIHTTLSQALMPTTDEALVERFWKLMEEESELEGSENRAQATYARTGDIAALEGATLREAGIQQDLAAVCRELRRRGIDPRAV